MHVLGVLSLIVSLRGVALTADSVPVRAPRVDSASAISVPGASRVAPAAAIDSSTSHLFELPVGPLQQAPRDTLRRRRQAIEVGDWYSRRLAIHRAVAFSTIPVFGVQYAAGKRLFEQGAGAPTWAKTMHRVGATALAGMFTVNTVTGAWNWWDSRTVRKGLVLRTAHALTMIGADAAFTYAGAKLSNEAENSFQKRREHRTVALSAIGLTALSGIAMKLLNK